MANIMLINPDYYEAIFSRSKVRSAISPGTPSLGLACIAAPLLEKGHDVRIVNLNLVEKPDEYLRSAIKVSRPDIVGITSTTPLIKNVYGITKLVKDMDRGIKVVAGGPHPSALPKDVLTESGIDCVVRGEGDFTFRSIVENGISGTTPNIAYKKDGGVVLSEKQDEFINDLDTLPFPAYELFDIKKYRQPLIASRTAPLGYIETSRGCYGRCVFCNKNIHGSRMRMKSPGRVIEEMKRMLSLGFREIHIIDDIFTADMDRAYEICEMIIKNNLKFPWYPRGGIRVDRVNPGLLKIMKKAGCYRIPFGVESGSQRVIDAVKKGISLEQAMNAVAMAKKEGFETECYFMLGLPTETEDDIKKTIDFAIKLDPDYAKFAITIPLPGTRMFEDMEAKGQIKTKDWNKYNFSVSPKELYDHDTLSWETIEKYYNISHRKFYFRPGYMLRMAVKTAANGTLFAHIKAFLKTRW